MYIGKIFNLFLIVIVTASSCRLVRVDKIDNTYGAAYHYNYTGRSLGGDSVIIIGQILNQMSDQEKERIAVTVNSSYYGGEHHTETVSCDRHGMFKLKLRKFIYCDVDVDVMHPDYRTRFWIRRMGEFGDEVHMYITMQAKQKGGNYE